MTRSDRGQGNPDGGWRWVKTAAGPAWVSDLVAPAGVLELPLGDGRLWLDRLDPSVAVAFGPPDAPDIDEKVAAQALGALYRPVGAGSAQALVGAPRDRALLRTLLGALAVVADLDGAERRDTESTVSGWALDGLEVLDELAVLCGRTNAGAEPVDEVVHTVAGIVVRSVAGGGAVVPEAGAMGGLVRRLAGQPLPVPRTARRVGLVREPLSGDEQELTRALSGEAVEHAVAAWDRVRHVLGGTESADAGTDFYALRLVQAWAARGADLFRAGDERLARRWLSLAHDGYGQLRARSLSVALSSPGSSGRDLEDYLDACQGALGAFMARIEQPGGSPSLNATGPSTNAAPVPSAPLTATELDGLPGRDWTSPLSQLDEIATSGDDAVVFLRLGRWVGWWDPVAPWRPIEEVELDGYAEYIAASGRDAVAVHPDGRLSLLRRGTPDVVTVVDVDEAVTSVAARPGGGFVVGCSSGAVIALDVDGADPVQVLWGGPEKAAPVHTVGCFADGTTYAVSESGTVWIDADPIVDVADLVSGERPGGTTGVEVRCVATSPDGNRVAVGFVDDGRGCCVVLPHEDTEAEVMLPDGRHPTAIAFVAGSNDRVYVGDATGGIWLMGRNAPRSIRPAAGSAAPGVEVLAIEPLDIVPGAAATFADGSVWSIHRDSMRRVALSTSGPIWSLTSIGTRAFGLTEFGDLLALSYDPEVLAAPVPVLVEPDAAGDLSISLGRPGVAGVCRWSPVPGVELCIDRADGLLVAATVDAEAPASSVQVVFGSSLNIDELTVMVDENIVAAPVTGWAVPDVLSGWCRVGLVHHDEQQAEPGSLVRMVAELERRYRQLAVHEPGPDDDAARNQLAELVSGLGRLLGNKNLPTPGQHRLNRALRLLEWARPDLGRPPSYGLAGASAALAAIEPSSAGAEPHLPSGRLRWDGVEAHAELAEVTLDAVKGGQQLVVTARPADPATPHATVTFRSGTLLAAMVHLRRDGDRLTGRSGVLWPWPTDAYVETTDPPQPLTIDTADRLFDLARQALDLERRAATRDENETEAVPSPELVSLWDRVAVEWETVMHRALKEGLAWVAAAAAQRAWAAYLLALARSDGQRLACHRARWAGAEGRRMAALLDPGRRATNPLWIPAWVAVNREDGTTGPPVPRRS